MLHSKECLVAGYSAAEDKCVDIMCPFIGVDTLQVVHHTHYVVLVHDAVAAEHVTRLSSDI